MRKVALFGRRWVGAGKISDGDSVRCVLPACLIDSALGGDPERLRSRLVMAATGWDVAVGAELKGLSKSDFVAGTTAARRTLRAVIQLLLNGIQPPRTA